MEGREHVDGPQVDGGREPPLHGVAGRHVNNLLRVTARRGALHKNKESVTKSHGQSGIFVQSRPGPDLNRYRHMFTREECSEGFWAGLASYVEQGGEARNFLRRKMQARGQAFSDTPKAERGRMAA
jgi:hypothetical protein